MLDALTDTDNIVDHITKHFIPINRLVPNRRNNFYFTILPPKHNYNPKMCDNLKIESPIQKSEILFDLFPVFPQYSQILHDF